MSSQRLVEVGDPRNNARNFDVCLIHHISGLARNNMSQGTRKVRLRNGGSDIQTPERHEHAYRVSCAHIHTSLHMTNAHDPMLDQPTHQT